MKILRLSLFNLKKNKREAFSVMLLTAITMLLMGIAICNITKVNTVFDKMFERTECAENMVLFPTELYQEKYKDILEEDERVTHIEEVEALFNMSVTYKKGNEEIGVTAVFVTENSEKKLETFVPETNLSETEMNALEHPIWLPVCFQYSQKYEVGSDFIVLLGGKEYPFVIAGFYEPGLMGGMITSMRWVVSEKDYEFLKAFMDEEIIIAYDSENSLPVEEYIQMCSEQASEDISADCMYIDKDGEKYNTTMFITLYLKFLIAVAVITMLSCLFMIRHKISNDIEEQMQSIGVLEALGYRSLEITLAYVCEYVITGGIGAVFGIFLMTLADPLLDDIIAGMVGYRVNGDANLGLQFGILCMLVLIILLSALEKAGAVKKYPPVVAFRKGIHTHHFGKNHFPLTGLKGNINLRLAMKELLGNTKHSIGIMICIFGTATAILFSFYIYDYLKTGTDAVIEITGMEASDVRVTLINDEETYELQEEILELPEVRKTLVTYPIFFASAKDKNENTTSQDGYVVVFDDFTKTENLHLKEGRYPKHANEIMITYGRAKKAEYFVGDSIVIEGDGIENSYIITGIVNSMSNGGNNLYFTSEGFRRSFPSFKPSVVEIYLKEDVDRHEFGEKLAELYGERVGDISSLLDLAEGQLEPVAIGMKVVSLVIVSFSVIVAAVILSTLADTTVRRKRKELGIMKAMGYVSKDLMQQIAFCIMPVAVVAVIIASIISVYLTNAFGFVMFAVALDVNFWIMVPIDICLLLFCYLVTYISAGKIKKISVTELMAE